MIRAHVLCCGGTGCTSSGSQKIQEIFQQEIERQGLAEEVKVVQTGCFGLCALGPVVIIYPDGTFYSHVTPDDVVEIVDEHLLKGRMVERLVYNEKSASAEHKEDEHAALNDTVFYKSQLRVALRNCGVINPENIEEYIGMDGYAALGNALTAGRGYPDRFGFRSARTRRCRLPDRFEVALCVRQPRQRAEVRLLQRRRRRPRCIHGSLHPGGRSPRRH